MREIFTRMPEMASPETYAVKGEDHEKFFAQANRFDAFYANGSKGLGNADSEQYFLPRTRKDQENLKLSKKQLDLRG